MTEFSPYQPKGALPPKPDTTPEPNPTNWGRTVFTMLLFFYIFLLLGWEMNTLFILVGVLFLHEGGHFFAMKLFGYQNVNMFFIPLLGAFVSGDKRNAPHRHELIMILAGPVPGIIVGMLVAHPMLNGGNETIILLSFFLLGLNVFNLLPIFPLDGGRVFEKLFASGNLYIRIVFLAISLMLLLLFLLATGALLIGLLLFGIVMQIIASVEMLRVRGEMDGQGLNYNTSYDELSTEEYWKMHALIKARYKNLTSDVEVAKRVASILIFTSPSRMEMKEKVLFFSVWLFFLIAPLVELVYIYREQIALLLLNEQ